MNRTIIIKYVELSIEKILLMKMQQKEREEKGNEIDG